MTATYAYRSRVARGPTFFEVMEVICGLIMMSVIAIIALLAIWAGVVGTLALVSYPARHAPLHMPDQPASARVANARFEPTPSDCPPYGECPHVHIRVRKENYLAFTRHLELAALNHGGAYAYGRSTGGFNRHDVYTIRLPQDAAYELLGLHISGSRRLLLPWHYVSPGHELWAVRWSEERFSATRGDADAFVTLSVKVDQLQRSDFYIFPVLLVVVLGAVLLIFYEARRSCRRGCY